MRENLWWTLRSSAVVRGLAANPRLASVLRRVSHLLLPSAAEGPMTVRSGIAAGLTFILHPRWQHAVWQGTYEPSAQRVAAEYFKPGSVIYDVGGGIGFYSLSAAHHGARVVTFEPDPANYARISRHADMNGLRGKVDLVPLAAFSRTGTLVMEPSQPGDSPGHAVAREIWTSERGERFQAACTTLDDFAREHPAPDLIKIDVEGSEAEVIRGAERLMREERPAILCEVHDDDLAGQAEQLVRSRGYRVTWLQDAPYHVRWLYATAS